jgi:valyl-tRNA synthetase
MIEQYGADAVRFSLILLTKEGQDTKLAPDKFEQGHRFGNKVWNAARFVLMSLGGEPAGDVRATLLEDRWIRSRLARTIDAVSTALDEYRLNDAAMTLYRFVWNDYCDWYLELAKPRLAAGEDATSRAAARSTLVRVLRDVLALLHPFTPFMTEVLWRSLHEARGAPAPGLLMNDRWPSASELAIDEAAESEMELVQGLVHAVCQVRTLTGVGERKPLAAVIGAPRASDRAALERHMPAVRALAFLESCELCAEPTRPPASALAVAGPVQVFVPLGEEVDLARLREQLERRAEKVRGGIDAVDLKLGNERFLEHAGDDIVEAERERRRSMEIELSMLESNLAGF